jgi:hypothetical protein
MWRYTNTMWNERLHLYSRFDISGKVALMTKAGHGSCFAFYLNGFRRYLFCLLSLYVVAGQAGLDNATAGSLPRTETCRDALYPLPGIEPGTLANAKESLYICLTDPGTPSVAYQIYVNGRKTFKVTPHEASSFNVYSANTYSVRCSDPNRKAVEENTSPLPKLDLPIEINPAHPICVVSTAIHNKTVRAAFVFDDNDRAHDSAIFEQTPEEHKRNDALIASAIKSGCARNFNRDGAPTLCLVHYFQDKEACPSVGQSCFDPALAGAWLLQHEFASDNTVLRLIPHVHGWVVLPNGDVRALAVDFNTGALVQGQKDTSFSRVSYGCNGELYQVAHGFAQGSTGLYCGRYTFDGKNLGIAKDKSAGFQYYEPAALGTKLMEPIRFNFAATLDEQLITVPHVGTKLSAYAIAEGSSGRHRAMIQVFGDREEIYFHIPSLTQAGKYTGKDAGRVTFNPQTMLGGFSTKDDPANPNEITIDVFDTAQGRISGRFSYTAIDQFKKLLQFKGQFDLPLYLHTAEQNK